MEEPRYSFEVSNLTSYDKYSFYDDRIEREWRTISGKGKFIYPTNRILGRISEKTTFASGSSFVLRTMFMYVFFGLVLYFGYESKPLDYGSYFFFFLAGLCMIRLMAKLRKEYWIYVLGKDGKSLFSVRERGLDRTDRVSLIREIKKYAESPNHPVEDNSG